MQPYSEEAATSSPDGTADLHSRCSNRKRQTRPFSNSQFSTIHTEMQGRNPDQIHHGGIICCGPSPRGRKTPKPMGELAMVKHLSGLGWPNIWTPSSGYQRVLLSTCCCAVFVSRSPILERNVGKSSAAPAGPVSFAASRSLNEGRAETYCGIARANVYMWKSPGFPFRTCIVSVFSTAM